MPLSDLQPELIALVLEHVDEKVNLACVNVLWRDTVERVLFRTIKLTSLAEELDVFQRVLIDRRQKYLKTLDFEILLPEYDQEGYIDGVGFGKAGRLETLYDMYANDKAFTMALARLFTIMARWDHDSKDTRVALEVKAYSMSDIMHREFARSSRDKLLIHSGRRDDVESRRYEHSFLRLASLPLPTTTEPKEFQAIELAQDQEVWPTVTKEHCNAACTSTMAIKYSNRAFQQLPLVPAVTAFKLDSQWDRLFWPSTSCHVASRLPSLRNIVADLGNDDYSSNVQRQAREGL